MKVNHGVRDETLCGAPFKSESPAGIYGSQQTRSRDNTLASDDTGMAPGRRLNIAFGERLLFSDHGFAVAQVSCRRCILRSGMPYDLVSYVRSLSLDSSPSRTIAPSGAEPAAAPNT